MRSPRWFSPSRDLAPILRRFNAQNLSITDHARQLESRLRDESIKRGRPLRKDISVRLTRDLVRRLQHAELFRFEICLDFVDHTKRSGISNEQARRAWYEVWSVLQG